jgi:hypothetical protein
VIDGRRVGTAPLPNPVDVGVGSHNVQAVIHGQPQTLRLTVAAGEKEALVGIAEQGR